MSSKYDAVKVQVIVQDDHYYFLSRFLLSKMLMFAKVPPTVAVQISLDLKRSLIVRGKTSIGQEEMESELYNLMTLYGLGPNNIHLFPLIKSFFATRVSLVVLLAGGAHCGKSSIAKQLSLVLNCSTVINVETLLGIVDTLTDITTDEKECRRGLDSRVGDDEEAWQSRCHRATPLVESAIEKSMAEGKSVIIEGEALDFTLYKTFFPLHVQSEQRIIILPILLHHPLLGATPPDTGTGSRPNLCSQDVQYSAATPMAKECALVHRHLQLLHEHRIRLLPLGKKNAEGEVSPEDCGTCWSASLLQPEQFQVVVNAIHDVVIQRIMDILQTSL